MSKQIRYGSEDQVTPQGEALEGNENQYESTRLLLKSMMEHREDIFSVLTEIMQTERNQNLINNLGSIYKFISELDSQWLSGTLDRTVKIIKEIPNTDRNVSGLMGLLRIMKDPEINAGLKVALNMLSVLGSSGKDEK